MKTPIRMQNSGTCRLVLLIAFSMVVKKASGLARETKFCFSGQRVCGAAVLEALSFSIDSCSDLERAISRSGGAFAPQLDMHEGSRRLTVSRHARCFPRSFNLWVANADGFDQLAFRSKESLAGIFPNPHRPLRYMNPSLDGVGAADGSGGWVRKGKEASATALMSEKAA